MSGFGGFSIFTTIVRYKGHKYEMVGIETTKYGPKAKLRFLNGEKEFLVKECDCEVVEVKHASVSDEELGRKLREL